MERKFMIKIINLAGDASEILLENGSEVYRVEESVCKIATHFNLKAQCFATLTCIIITFESEQGEVLSIVRRINSRTTNLDKVYKVFYLIEKIGNHSFMSIERKLRMIRKESPYSFRFLLLGNILVCIFFVTLFNGNYSDMLVTFIGGILIATLSKGIDYLKLGNFFSNLLCGFLATSIACFFQKIGVLDRIDISVISMLMLLVPGVSFINSIRDIFSGDLITGISRTLEVIMVGTAIAVGSGIALKIVGGI